MKHHEIVIGKSASVLIRRETVMFAVAAILSPGPPPPGLLPAIDPSQQPLPGTDVLQGLINGLARWGLIAAVAGMLVGAVLWALGHHSANYQQSYNGRKGVLVAGAAALVMGAAPALINFFFRLGQSAK
jgi:hypothetical protein